MTTATTIQTQPDNRASHKVAHGAISTMLMDDSLPPDVKEHLANARNALEAHARTAAPEQKDDGMPAGESIAASKRRAAGEDPDAKEDDGETDDAPSMKGDKPNPLAGLTGAKRWATATKDSDDAPPAKAPAKAAPAKAKPRFFGRGR